MTQLHIEDSTGKVLFARREEALMGRLQLHLRDACSACRQTIPGTKPLSSSYPSVHATPEDLAEALQFDTDPLHFQILLHLAAVCPQCREQLGELHQLHQQGLLPADFAITELDIFLGRSRKTAPKLLAKLLDRPEEASLQAVQHEEEFRSWGLVELLCTESRAYSGADQKKTLHLANLADLLAPLVRCPFLPQDCVNELRMFAKAHRGNALRISDQLHSANLQFFEAELLWNATQTQHFNYRERVLSLRSTLEMELRKFSESSESLAEALELARAAADQDVDLQATLLIQRYLVLAYGNNETDAIQSLEEAGKLLEPAGPSRLASIVLQNQLDYLSRVGLYREALDLLPQLQEMSTALGMEPDRIKLTWTRARIAQGTGESETGIRLFQEAQQSFLKANQGYRAALVSLELATVYFSQGQLQEVRQLALEMLPVFQAQQIGREALAALALFEQAAVAEQLTEQLVQDLVDYFHQAQSNPELPFHPA